jgi:ribonuclease BN (tRNA processing enzyme)
MARDARATGRDVTPPRPVVVPVGVGAAYGRPEEGQSCYLVQVADRSFVLDLGSGNLNRLQEHVAPERLSAIVVTHLHPDHCVDLLALRVYLAHGPGRDRGSPLPVLGPPGLREQLLGFPGPEGWDEVIRFEELAGPSGERDLGGAVTLRYREVPHLPPTFALRVEAGGGAVCFGADCADNEELPALAAGVDVLLCECSFGAAEVPAGVPHLNGRQAGGIAARAGARRLLLAHCFPEQDRDAALAEARAAFGGPVQWAVQGEAVAA